MVNKEATRKQYAENLVKLIAENPTLPIIPMVKYEVVPEDWGYWMGSFGSSSIGEYALYNDRYFDEREAFKEEYYECNSDDLDEKFNYTPSISDWSVNKGVYTKEQLEINNKNEKLMDEYLDRIAENCFKKAIIIYIELPEE